VTARRVLTARTSGPPTRCVSAFAAKRTPYWRPDAACGANEPSTDDYALEEKAVDHERFDTLLRLLSTSPSRRGALRLLSGATIGGLLVTGAVSSEAKRRSSRSKGKHKKRRTSSGATPSTSSPPPEAPAEPTCADGVRNGDETDVDCGGTCPRCAVGKTCATRDDCASARCASGVCQTCADPLTDCGTDTDGSQCFCREHESGQRFCTRQNGRPFPAGTACGVCQNGELCFLINGGAGGIECVLPCGG
jgi:hypothetical protein